MRPFSAIFEAAARRKGGAEALEQLLVTPQPASKLTAISGDRWLSEMTRCIFQAGFNWSLVDKKWPHFETAFEGFDVNRWTLMSEDDVDRLMRLPGIVANVAKIRSVGANAVFLARVSESHGSVGAFFASWAPEDHVELLRVLRTEGSRLGGKTGQVFLRRMGVDTPVFTDDVVASLVREGVVTRAPSSKGDFAAVQAAFDAWRRESGRALTQISQILALSADR